MARSNARRGTPDMGFKFSCQFCEQDIYDTPLPILKWVYTLTRGHLESEPVQCCRDCAQDIDDSNAKIAKSMKKKQPERQVRPLREGSELPPDVQVAKEQLEAAKKAESEASKATDVKLDKVLDALAGLTQLMMLQMQTQGLIPNAPSTPEKSEEPASGNKEGKQKPRSAGATKPRSANTRKDKQTRSK